MSFGLTFDKLIIIAVIAVFLVGPDRLPAYAAQLARLVKSLRSMADGAKDRMREEMGPEFDEIDWRKLDPRQYDPRRIVREALSDVFDPDVPLPPELYDGRPAPSSSAERLYAAARAQPDLPLRELARHLTTGASLIGFVGTPEQLADHIVEWQDAGAVDGFTIMGSTLPYELAAFVDHVVPILQARGRFRTEYTGTTLRENLGLDRPAGHAARSRAGV